MKRGLFRAPILNRLTLLALALIAPATAAVAQPIPVQVDLTSLRAIQTYNLEDKADDQAYLLITGVAKGEALPPQKLPKEGAWTAGIKTPPVNAKEPVTLWKGELDRGQFVLLTVTLLHGEGKDEAKTKEFLDKKAAAEEAVSQRKQKTLSSGDDFKKLTSETLKAHRGLVTKIKEVYGREKNADHFGGQFTLALLNENGQLVKRLDPVGLTHGEHFGTDVKVYSKLKFTRNNVLIQDGEEFYPQQLGPLNDEEDTVRVKMLETEYVQVGDRKRRNVTDYLLDIQVKGADGKPEKWELGGENFGPGPLHTYWDFAQ